MKAVILCAGEGTRMRPLTLSTPKQLLKVGGKTILEHIFETLPDEVDEVILVVKYLAEQIANHFGSEFCGRKVKYAFQEGKEYGTWVGLLAAKPFLNDDKFLVLVGDDIIDPGSIRNCLKHDFAVLAKEHPEPQKFGVVVADANGKIVEFVEKPKMPPSNLVNTGMNVLDSRIFNYPVPRHLNGEFYLVDAVSQLMQDHDVFMEHAHFWLPIGTPEDLARADEYFKTLAGKY